MIYVILTYLFSPLLYLIAALRKKKNVNRILVIQTAKIGDMICSTPVFREIKKKYPEAHLTVMVNPATQEILKHNPHVDEVIAIKPADYAGFAGKFKLSNLMRRGNYDIAVCLNPNVPFAVAALWGSVPVRLSIMPDFSGLTFKLASVFFTCLERHAAGRLAMETYMRMLKGIGIESNNLSKEVYKSAEADKKVDEIATPRRIGARNDRGNPLIGIAVSSGNKLKELGAGKISEIANALLDNPDVTVVLIGSEQDRDAVHNIIDCIAEKQRVLDTTGLLNLSELPALIERLSLFIGVDTGIAYMADALNIPVIHLAGPIDTTEQRPLGREITIIQHKLPCVPCTYVFKAAYACKRGDRMCVTSVSAAEIVEAAGRLLCKKKT